MKGNVIIPKEMQKWVFILCILLSVTLLLSVVLMTVGYATLWKFTPHTNSPSKGDGEKDPPAMGDPNADYPFVGGNIANVLLVSTADTVAVPAASIGSSNAAIADLSANTIIASRFGDKTIYPASMTKVMTLITAVEYLPYEKSLKDTITISQEVYDRMKAEGASGIGFEPGEVLSVESLLYALILESDGVAACELARYIAGSESAFVERMNQKAAAMGLSGTHFENTTGLYHKDHVSTSRDIATIMAYAMSMDLCRTILTTKEYKASCTLPTGKTISYYFQHTLLHDQFQKNAANQPSGLEVIAGKTGYTPESGCCLVTYAVDAAGKGYVCVTADAENYAGCIEDYMTLYQTYIQK